LIAPLGFAAGALPLAPAGIGVGQAAFFALFKMVAPAYAVAGVAAAAALATLDVAAFVFGQDIEAGDDMLVDRLLYGWRPVEQLC